MTCKTHCHDEEVSVDPASPGPIRNDETISRGAYGRSAHYNSQGVKASFIRDRDLLAGCLSVWRVDGEGGVEEVREILQSKAPDKNQLWDMFAAKASNLRSIRIPSRPDEPVLHAYDDCTVDQEGNKHPRHAIISICSQLAPQELEKDAPMYVELRDSLLAVLRQHSVWTLQR